MQFHIRPLSLNVLLFSRLLYNIRHISFTIAATTTAEEESSDKSYLMLAQTLATHIPLHVTPELANVRNVCT